MNKKNGFTLVELMAVIVIIGVLAAVAIPKIMTATAKAKAAEGPMFLGAISRLQDVVMTEHGIYIYAEDNSDKNAWIELGMDVSGDKLPVKYFDFSAAGTEVPESSIPPAFKDKGTSIISDYKAKALLQNDLGDAKKDDFVTIDNFGNKEASKSLNPLIASFGAASIQ